MTTVAFRDGVMAADTMITNGNQKQHGVQKIYRIGSWVVGFAGDFGDIPVLCEWLEKQAECRSVPDWGQPDEFPEDIDTDVLIACAAGLFELDSKGRVIPVPVTFTAIGSGAKYAIGAMAYGASATKAIQIAMDNDTYSGGEVRTERVGTKLEVV